MRQWTVMARPSNRESPPRPPAYSPARQPQTRPRDPALQQRAWAALMLALISLYAMLMIGEISLVPMLNRRASSARW